MALLRVYVALSLDGYIADTRGGVAWLDAYHDPAVDFMAFVSTIGVTVMGRRTFDEALARGPWMFGEGRAVVMTHRPIPKAPKGVEAFDGDVGELATRLRSDLEGTGKDVWLMGGGESIRAFHQAGEVDRFELYVVPVFLGAGIPLFPRREEALTTWRPTRTQAYPSGLVELWYEPAVAAAPKRRGGPGKS